MRIITLYSDGTIPKQLQVEKREKVTCNDRDTSGIKSVLKKKVHFFLL